MKKNSSCQCTWIICSSFCLSWILWRWIALSCTQCLLMMADLFFIFGLELWLELCKVSHSLWALRCQHWSLTSRCYRAAETWGIQCGKIIHPCAADKIMEEAFISNGSCSWYRSYRNCIKLPSLPKVVRTTQDGTKYMQVTIDKTNMTRGNYLDTQHGDLCPLEVTRVWQEQLQQ